MQRVTKKDRQTRAMLLMKHGRPCASMFRQCEDEGGRKRPKGSAFRWRLYCRSQRCCWCERNLPFTEATVEHLIRKADGGRNTMDNCRIACGPCNWSRGDETDPVKVKAKGDQYRRRKSLAKIMSNYTPPVVVPPEVDARYRGLRAEFLRLIGEAVAG